MFKTKGAEGGAKPLTLAKLDRFMALDVARLLVAPFGLVSGVLLTRLDRRPDHILVGTSPRVRRLRGRCCRGAGWNASLSVCRVWDAHGCFDEAEQFLAQVRPPLLHSRGVLANVTGGTTAMQYLVERVAAQAERFGVPTTRYALLDRRPRDEQERDPYVLGEVVPLRGDEPAADE